MMVKVIMPVRPLNLVVPLSHKDTAMRTTDTAAPVQARSGAVSPLIGESLRPGDVDSSTPRRTRVTTPLSRTSRTATATGTTRTTGIEFVPSADSIAPSGAPLTPFSMADLVQAWLDCRRNKLQGLENPDPDHEEAAGQPAQQKQGSTPVVAVKGIEKG